MLARLLAQAAELRSAPPEPSKIDRIHDAVVTNMPWGGLGLMFVLLVATLVVAMWVAWGQRTLATNQVRLARLLRAHLEEHTRAGHAGDADVKKPQ